VLRTIHCQPIERPVLGRRPFLRLHSDDVPDTPNARLDDYYPIKSRLISSN